uniref:Uncharacterized protein n=1 Tax=Lepeophtheirus salmonis TaxID=72036 RepID=A0A0K2U9T5_LEPSM
MKRSIQFKRCLRQIENTFQLQVVIFVLTLLILFTTAKIILYPTLKHSIQQGYNDDYKNEILNNNISQLRNILIKGSVTNELPIKDIEKHPEKTYNIPSTIHIIWVWTEIPQKYIRNVLLMHEMNPHFSLYLWLDDSSFQNATLISWINRERLKTKNVDSLQLNNPELIYDAKKLKRKGVLSDLLRYEIVFSFGEGVSPIRIKPLMLIGRKKKINLFNDKYLNTYHSMVINKLIKKNTK